MSVFAPGSISLRLYPHNELSGVEIVRAMRAQAAAGVEAGFDGVMVSEHHGGFGGYLPNPIQMAGWLLEAMPQGWAAPCPVLLPLRPWALVAEELAWLAARFPGRVGLGVASGSLEADFSIMGTDKDNLTARYAAGLESVSGALSGRAPGPLAGDRAVAACAESPIPVLSAAMSLAAARRSAACGAGMLYAGVTANHHCRAMTDAYRAAGGTGPIVLVRRLGFGVAAQERYAAQVKLYRSYTTEQQQSKWREDQLLTGAPETIAAELRADLAETGADSLNLRIHVPGIGPDEALHAISLSAGVLRRLRDVASRE